jgi:hypothetical protein
MLSMEQQSPAQQSLRAEEGDQGCEGTGREKDGGGGMREFVGEIRTELCCDRLQLDPPSRLHVPDVDNNFVADGVLPGFRQEGLFEGKQPELHQR